MIVIDFLFYNLTIWFTENKDKLSWSTPLERAVYAIGLFTIFWLVSIGEIVQFLFSRKIVFNISLIPFVVLGLLIMQLYKYIYITKRRFELISSFKQTQNKYAANITIFIAFFSTFLPFLIFMVFS